MNKKYLFIFIGLYFFLAPQAHAAISYVQVTTSSIESAVNTITSTFSGGTTAGNFIVVGLFLNATGEFPTFSDSRGDSFTVAISSTQSTDGHETFIAYATNIAGGTTTVSSSYASAAWPFMTLYEFSGVATASSTVVDRAVSNTTDSSTTMSSSATTTANANDLLIGYFGMSGAGTSVTQGAGWATGTPLYYIGTNESYAEYRIVTSTSSYAATATSNGAENSSANFVAFKAAVADTTPPSVAWTSPAANATVSSTVTLTASSTDNVAVSSVAFYEGSYGGILAGATLVSSSSAPSGTLYSVSWDTTGVSNGSTTLWALATDTSNNTSTASTTVNVNNKTIQLVATTSQSNDTVLPAINASSGNLIVVFSKSETTAATAVHDSKNNTYTNIGCKNITTVLFTCMFYAKNITGDANLIVTSTGPSGFNNLLLWEFSGAATSTDPFDVSSTVTGTTAFTLTTPTFTTNGTDAIVTAMGSEGGNMTSFTAGKTFGASSTVRWPASVGNDTGGEDREGVAAGSGTSSMTWGGSAAAEEVLYVAAFKAATAAATTTNNATGSFAWGDKAGWVNFGTNLGGFTVGGSSVSGYAWSQNFGWINLAPASSGVTNDGLGNLGGYAWSQNAGWIGFFGVTISSTGTFVGIASGTTAGNINFNCTYCLVSTTWRAASTSLTIGTPVINGGSTSTITLSPGATTAITIQASSTDSTGGSITYGTSTLYRTSLGTGCTANNLNCYQIPSSSCSFSGVTTGTLTCTTDVWYFAQSTGISSSSFPSDSWTAVMTVNDSTAHSASATSSAVNVGVLTAISVQGSTSTASTSYSYYRSITVTSTASIASGTLSNFPMLVSSTVTTWEASSTAGGAGHIQNLCTAPNGGQEPCDLVFATSTANCDTAPLKFETESYTSSTGALVDWVNVPTLTAGTVIYACYGSASVTTDQSHPSSTWNSNYAGVWHLADAGVATSTDSTSNAVNGTNNSVTATSTKIDGGGSFNGSSGYVDLGSTPLVSSTQPFTVSYWANLRAITDYEVPLTLRTDASENWRTYYTAGQNYVWFGSGSGWVSLQAPLSSSPMDAWHHIVVTYNGNGSTTAANFNFYDNGVSATTSDGGAFASGDTGNSRIGGYTGGNSWWWNGLIDEVRVSNSARSASWILTEYNNQNSPSTFYAVGNETAGSGAGINYGSLAPGTNTSSTDQVTTIQNAGNSSTSLLVYGTALLNGTSTIATSSQQYATSPFIYGSGATSTALTDTATLVSGFVLTAPTSTNAVSSIMYWGLQVASGTAAGTYNGVNTFVANYYSTPASTSTTPTLVQTVGFLSNGNDPGNHFRVVLPNPVLSGNFVGVAVTYPSGTVPTITDNKGTNTWTNALNCTSTQDTEKYSLFYSLNTASGTQIITVTFPANRIELNIHAVEFNNIALSSAVDGTPVCTVDAYGPNVDSGAITTTQDGDLIWNYIVDSNNGTFGTNHDISSITFGGNFTGLYGDQSYATAAQFTVQAAHGDIHATSTWVQTSNDPFASLAIAFKAASAGTAPSTGIRIIREVAFEPLFQHSPFTLPCSGNLLVAMTPEARLNEDAFGSITSTPANTWNMINPGTNYPYLFHADNATCSSALTGTVNVSGTVLSDYFIFYDITGAATSPLDTAVTCPASSTSGGAGTGSCINNGTMSSVNQDIVDAPDITPSTAHGLVISGLNDGIGPASDSINYTFDLLWYTSSSDNNWFNNGDAASHYYNPSTSSLNFGYHWANNGDLTSWDAMATAFKAQ